MTSLILREFFESRQLVTKNIDLPPWDLFLNSNEENNIIIWHFVRDKCQVPNSDPHGFEYIISNLEFSFFWIMFDEFWWYSMYITLKYEKWKTRNLLTSNLPAEFWQTLGYEFHFFQKTWIHFRRKRTNFSIFGRGNPYHQSTYRFPPLHPISAPDCWVHFLNLLVEIIGLRATGNYAASRGYGICLSR